MSEFAGLSGFRLIGGIVLALGLLWLLYRRTLSNRQAMRTRNGLLMAPVSNMLDAPNVRMQGPNEPPRVDGCYKGLPVQVRPVVDTLSTRKLPSLWLMVTIPTPMSVEYSFDFMMRSAGGGTFSNFDLLPYSSRSPDGWPVDGNARSDEADALLPGWIATAVKPLTTYPQFKEFLLTPKGMRIVVQLAEADRARYGVLRQAYFGDIQVSGAFLAAMLDVMTDTARGLQRQDLAA